jgi:hypothetical protein
MRHQPSNVLLNSEGPLDSPELFGIGSIAISVEVKTGTKTPTCAGQYDYPTSRIYRNAIQKLMQSFNEFRRHRIQSLWSIQPDHNDAWDWPL